MWLIVCYLFVGDSFYTKVKKKSAKLKVTLKKPLMVFYLAFQNSLVNHNPI